MEATKRSSANLRYSAITLLVLLFLSAAAIGQTESQTSGTAASDREDTVVVNVLAASPTVDSGDVAGPALSKGFVVAGLSAMSALRSWQSHLTYMIRNGYPLAEQWLIEDRDAASDRLLIAAQAATTSADRTALTELNSQYRNLQQWSDQMVEGKRKLELAQIYMSPGGLDNNSLFQKTVECANFLTPMLASGRLRTSTSCQ